HADALIFFALRHGLIAIHVAFVPHFARAVVDDPLPALFAAHGNDDDGAGVVLGLTMLRLHVRLRSKRRPAARMPIIGVNDRGEDERQPDDQHIGSWNIAQEPAASGRYTRGHCVHSETQARRRGLEAELLHDLWLAPPD